MSAPTAVFKTTSMRVLSYGDSLTAGYHRNGRDFHPYATRLAARIGVKVDHVGLSGWTIEQMIASQDLPACSDVCDRTWPGLKFKLQTAIEEGAAYTHVALLGGTNDMCTSTPSSILTNIHALHQVAWDAGAQTLALTIPGMAVESSLRGVTLAREQVNAGIRRLVAESQGKALLVEVDKAVPHLELSSADRDELWERDGLHMKPAGYDRIADIVADVLLAQNLQGK